MAGVLSADIEMHDRNQALDYVELHTQADGPTAAARDAMRGHEFHYSSTDYSRTDAADARFVFDTECGDGIEDDLEGSAGTRTLGMYYHVHPPCGAVDTFVDSM